MTTTELLQRARSAIGHGCLYGLGKGGFNPAHEFPWSSSHECDCSGFIAWALGVSRMTDNPFYQHYNGGWLETTALVRDARCAGFGFVDEVPWPEAVPGMIVVYGDVRGKDGRRHQGHVGLVSEAASGPSRVVHCSLGNYRTRGDAIQETGAEVFRERGIVARVAWIDYDIGDTT